MRFSLVRGMACFSLVGSRRGGVKRALSEEVKHVVALTKPVANASMCPKRSTHTRTHKRRYTHTHIQTHTHTHTRRLSLALSLSLSFTHAHTPGGALLPTSLKPSLHLHAEALQFLVPPILRVCVCVCVQACKNWQARIREYVRA
jgi:hypothetical protein